MNFLKNYSKLHCRNFKDVEEKLRKFVGNGSDHFLVVADFDYTLSRTKTVDGEQCCQSYGVFEEDAKNASKEIKEKFEELDRKFSPIETDPKLVVDQKIPHMVEWWMTSNNLILQLNYTAKRIEELVAQSSIRLRCGVGSMIEDLNRYNIPLVVFSAGIGNVIEVCLKNEIGVIPANVHIISNEMLFDENGIACDFSSPLIHTFCKDGSMIDNCESLKKECIGRYNVLLLGDSLGDLNMASGFRTNAGNVTTLKIGFLNRRFEEDFEKFSESFDIVLIDDQTVTIPAKIINSIVSRKLSAEN